MVTTLTQLAASLVLLAGWSFYVWRFTGRMSLRRHGWWVWCTLGGLAAHLLLLQQIWYLGVPLSKSAWVSLVIAALGCVGWIHAWVRVRNQNPAQARCNFPIWIIVGMTVFVCSAQGWSLFARGAQHYFGRAEYDQFNYVVTAQFLQDYSAKTPSTFYSDRAIYLRGKEGSTERITQSVLQAEIAVISRSDAQSAYGSAVLVFLGLLGLAVVGYFHALGASRAWGVGVGCLAIVLPAVTNVHLNGFFSQTSVFWVFIAIPGVLLRNRDDWRRAAITGVLVGYLIGAYTELAPLGYGTAVVAVFCISRSRSWIRLLGAITLTALVFNFGYLDRAGVFFVSQLLQAKGPDFLASWTPDSGTWKGFGRNFVGEIGDFGDALGGLALVGLAVCSVWRAKTPYRRRFVVSIVIPVFAAVGLLLLPKLPAYAFGKLLMTVTPLFLAGTLAIGVRAGRAMSWATAVVATVIASLSMHDVFLAQKEIVQGTEKIAAVDMPSVPRALSLAQKRTLDGPVFLLASENPLSAGWLAYILREEITYLYFQEISDRSFPSEWHRFRQVPSGLARLYYVSESNVYPIIEYDSYPAILITGASEAMIGTTRVWRTSDEMRIDIRFLRPHPGRLRWICLRVMAPPGSAPVDVITPDGLGVIPIGEMAAIPANVARESYTIRLRAKNAVPFTTWLYGLEPVRTSYQEPYPYQAVKLAR